MGDWPDCIVTYIDLIGISKELDEKTAEGIKKMRQMHQLVRTAANGAMPKHVHAYYWTDSVLLLALPASFDDYQPIMREANGLKRAIDRICPSYAISMKGKAMPEPAHTDQSESHAKAVYIRASSLAFSNCFAVERQAKLGKLGKVPWYVDDRIASHISSKQRRKIAAVTVFPRRTKRRILLFAGDLWKHDMPKAK